MMAKYTAELRLTEKTPALLLQDFTQKVPNWVNILTIVEDIEGEDRAEVVLSAEWEE